MRDLFKEYRTTTKEERVEIRKEFARLKDTERFRKHVAFLYRQQRKQCFYCDSRIWSSKRESYHIDHRIPIYYGGDNRLGNFVLACPDCNRTKLTHQLVRNKEWLNRKNRGREALGKPTKLYT